MCLILICEKDWPENEQIEAAYMNNSDGMGIAWRENKTWRFVKGITKTEDLIKVMERAKFPAILHFRIATSGGKSRSLCHPFVVGPNNNELSGTTDSLLFHNGHCPEWKMLVAAAAFYSGEIKGGNWSDTRAVACALGRLRKHGERVRLLDLIGGGKYVLTHKGGFTKIGAGWVQVEGKKIWASNETYKPFTLTVGKSISNNPLGSNKAKWYEEYWNKTWGGYIPDSLSSNNEKYKPVLALGQHAPVKSDAENIMPLDPISDKDNWARIGTSIDGKALYMNDYNEVVNEDGEEICIDSDGLKHITDIPAEEGISDRVVLKMSE